ncbi:MAG: rhodanese-like domain-containing protein [Planctomycetota bacterium]
MSKKRNATSFRSEAGRAALLLGASAVLGLAVNTFSARGMPIFVDEPAPVAPGAPSAPGVVVNTSVQPRTITLADVKRIQANPKADVRIVDVRGLAAYDVGHIPEAIHVPEETLLKNRAAVESALRGATLIVVHCDNDDCPKAEHAAEKLVKFGLQNVRVLVGGWDGYKAAGYPVEESRR